MKMKFKLNKPLWYNPLKRRIYLHLLRLLSVFVRVSSKPMYIVHKPLQIKMSSAEQLCRLGLDVKKAILHEEITHVFSSHAWPVVATSVVKSKRFKGWEYSCVDADDQKLLLPECCLEPLIISPEEEMQLSDAVSDRKDEIDDVVSRFTN